MMCSETYQDHRGLVRLMLRRLGARPVDVDDLTQDVLLVLYRRRDGYDPTRPLRPWLHGIAVRVLVAHRRRRATRRAEVLDDDALLAVEGAGPLPDRMAELQEGCAQVLAALDAIDPERAAVLWLHDVDGTPMPEVASALGVGLNTAYSRLRLARANLREAAGDIWVQGDPSRGST
jgi:RNA polymerase sigma-70 factor (ECF subfamily)